MACQDERYVSSPGRYSRSIEYGEIDGETPAAPQGLALETDKNENMQWQLKGLRFIARFSTCSTHDAGTVEAGEG
jgi:hypothetical protein